MKKLAITSVILLFSFTVQAQSASESLYDFWLGTWDLTWTGANGKEEKGRNVISKILDGKVIQENFEVLAGSQKGYKGKSMSVYNQASKTWYQTWVDNQGGNINFTGEVDGDRKIFKTALQNRNGQQIISRMIFYNIKKDTFMWDWESTTDGGKSWKLNWRIQYTRAN